MILRGSLNCHRLRLLGIPPWATTPAATGVNPACVGMMVVAVFVKVTFTVPTAVNVLMEVLIEDTVIVVVVIAVPTWVERVDLVTKEVEVTVWVDVAVTGAGVKTEVGVIVPLANAWPRVKVVLKTVDMLEGLSPVP